MTLARVPLPKLVLRDHNLEMVEAWRRWFDQERLDIEIEHADIFDGQPCDAILNPANSFGIMTGGIDLTYAEVFGWDMVERLITKIDEDWWGELPVGAALTLATGAQDYRWLVSAPTMRTPESSVGTINAYHAFRAALLAVARHNAWHDEHNQIRSLLSPGLCTGVGELPAAQCARQMMAATRRVNRCPTDFSGPRNWARFMRGEV